MSLLLALVGGGGGPPALNASMTATLAAVTLTTSASLPVSASLTATLSAVTLTSDADISVVGSLSSTLADVALSADADLPVVASLSVTLSDVTLTGNAALPLSADLVGATFGDVTLDASAIVVLASTKVRAHLLSPLWNVPWVDSRDLLFSYSVGFLKQIVDVINGTEQDTGGYAVDLGYLRINVGTGAPNGVVIGSPPDIYLNRAGGAGTTVYTKESGTNTNAGWVGV